MTKNKTEINKKQLSDILDACIENNFLLINLQINETFCMLFPNSDHKILDYISNLYVIFEKILDVKVDKIKADDFMIIGQNIKENSTVSLSFFTAVSIQLVNVFMNINAQSLKSSVIRADDFVFRAIIYTVLILFIHENSVTENYLTSNKTKIMELLELLYTRYTSNDIVHEIKKIVKQSSVCCSFSNSTYTTHAIEKLLEQHVYIVISSMIVRRNITLNKNILEPPLLEPPLLEPPLLEPPLLEPPLLEPPLLELPLLEPPLLEPPLLEPPFIEVPLLEDTVLETPVLEAPLHNKF
jgi:hypothetical protein